MKGRQRQKEKTFQLDAWQKLLARQEKVLLGEQGGSAPEALLSSLPAREDASLLVACQLCLDRLWKWIKSKLSKYAPKKDRRHLHQGLDCNGCPVQHLCIDSLSFATGCLTAYIATSTATSFSFWKRDLASLNTQADILVGFLGPGFTKRILQAAWKSKNDILK